MQAVIVINLFAFASVAYLANKLVSRARLADVALKDKSSELENLQVLHEIIVHSISTALSLPTVTAPSSWINPAAQGLLGGEPSSISEGLNVHQLFLDQTLLLPRRLPRNEVRARTPSGA